MCTTFHDFSRNDSNGVGFAWVYRLEATQAKSHLGIKTRRLVWPLDILIAVDALRY